MNTNPLKAALQRAGLTQGEAAKRLGVSEQSVYYWASGKRPLPPARATQLASIIGCDPAEFRSLFSEKSRAVRLERKDPTTLFGFLVTFVFGSPGTFRDTVEDLAQFLDVTLYDLRAWIEGETRIPVASAIKLGDRFPGFNPKVLKYEVDYQAAVEPRAVQAALAHVAERDPRTFVEARALLAQYGESFFEMPDHREGRRTAADDAERLLDNERQVTEPLRATAAKFAPRRLT